MTRSPKTTRSAPPYRPPIARGQTYPPLGFAEDGTPQYQYTPPDPKMVPRNEAAPVRAPEPSEPEPPRQNPVRRTMLGIASVIGIVLLVAGVLALISAGNDDSLPERAAPPVTEQAGDPYLDDPYLDDIEPDDPLTIEPSLPSRPRTTAPSRPLGQPQPTVYEVTTEGPATVLYRDGTQTKVISHSGGTWTQPAVTTGLARVSVLPEHGAAATCRITVDGTVVSERSLEEAQGALRILVCQG